MRFLTDRKRAGGNGAAGTGTQQHWEMMMRSIAMVFIVPLFVLTFGAGIGGTHEEVLAYFGRPFPAIITALMILVGLRHLRAEMDETIEDYIHGTAQKVALMVSAGFTYTLMVAGLFALAKIAL
ncbi:MAG: succinate dehydrogenase, hydrophobic membrane anchor protein [Pelagimonas sp.]|jgi:succinate dehydrogenase / fumarate reductase membrane anchor subunit|nr:succinate dehydrogenase, hydrophobic membrane anchor protein [Pelagimonas sp.]